MSDKPNYRMERIERLLKELEYEVVRGMMEGEVDETLQFTFIVPLSKRIHKGIVHCEFRTRPAPHYMAMIGPPRLQVVK